MILTDPPYGKMSKRRRIKGTSQHIISAVLPEFYRLLKQDGAIYMFSSFSYINEWLYRFQVYFKLVNLLVWNKERHSGNFTGENFGYSYEFILYGTKGTHKLNKVRNDVFNYKRENFLEHPNRKPLELCVELIEMSTKKGDLVLDPFVGSGTVAEACKITGRNFIAFELDKGYASLASRRVAETPANKACTGRRGFSPQLASSQPELLSTAGADTTPALRQ